MAGRRVPFTCEKNISQQYVTKCVIYSLLPDVRIHSLAPFRSL